LQGADLHGLDGELRIRSGADASDLGVLDPDLVAGGGFGLPELALLGLELHVLRGKLGVPGGQEGPEALLLLIGLHPKG
jgi:hypothetical protein